MRKQSNGHSSLQHTLEQLTAQRSQIDEAIAALEKLQGIDVLPTDTGGAKEPPLVAGKQPILAGKTISEAVIEVLRATKAPLGVPELTHILADGGVVFRSRSPINTVAGTLSRLQARKEGVKAVDRGQWAYKARRGRRKGADASNTSH